MYKSKQRTALERIWTSTACMSPNYKCGWRYSIKFRAYVPVRGAKLLLDNFAKTKAKIAQDINLSRLNKRAEYPVCSWSDKIIKIRSSWRKSWRQPSD